MLQVSPNMRQETNFFQIKSILLSKVCLEQLMRFKKYSFGFLKLASIDSKWNRILGYLKPSFAARFQYLSSVESLRQVFLNWSQWPPALVLN